MDIGHWLLVVALAVQFYNLGVIWFVQIVEYPLFARVGPAEYIDYHGFYARSIPFPVILPGFASFILPLGMPWLLPASVPAWLAIANAAMGMVGLLVTVGLEIPRHNRLEKQGKQDAVIAELIRYNWPRTVSITASAALTLAMAAFAFAPV